MEKKQKSNHFSSSIMSFCFTYHLKSLTDWILTYNKIINLLLLPKKCTCYLAEMGVHGRRSKTMHFS